MNGKIIIFSIYYLTYLLIFVTLIDAKEWIKLKKYLSLILSSVIAFMFSLSALAAEPVASGDIIEFGSYPQTHITDEALISELNSLIDADNWVSMEYYTGTDYGNIHISENANYTDITLDGVKYRGVLYTEYRTVYSNSGTYKTYINNGYAPNIIHWFRFEPIQWKILDASEGFICAVNILESRAITDTIFVDPSINNVYYSDADLQHYANDYSNSTIRTWLNTSFINSAFNNKELDIISETEIDNSYNAWNTEEFTCENTVDKVFLLASGEAYETSYFPDNASRQKAPTDYAMMEGIANYVPNPAASNFWYLRTPDNSSKSQGYINYAGKFAAGSDTDGNDFGIVPAMCIDLDSFATLYDEEPEPTDLYKDLTLSFDNGILTVNGTGLIPDPANSDTKPLEEYAADTNALFIEDGITAIAGNAFSGFDNLKMIIIKGECDVSPLAFAQNENITTVFAWNKMTLSETSFANGNKIDLYEKKDTPHNGTTASDILVHPFTFSDHTLKIDGDVEFDYYSLFDTLAVFCLEYDEINTLSLGSLTSDEIRLTYFNEKDFSFMQIEERTVKNPEFTVTIPHGSDNKQISFNELCKRAAEDRLNEFYLVVSAEDYEEILDTEVTVRENFFQKALKWVVGLINFVFSVFTKIFK